MSSRSPLELKEIKIKYMRREYIVRYWNTDFALERIFKVNKEGFLDEYNFNHIEMNRYFYKRICEAEGVKHREGP